MIYVKVHNTENGKIIAMCDESLIGKVLEDGKLVMDLKAYSDFYNGSLITPSQFPDMPADEIVSANVVGEESVDVAIKHRIIGKGHVKMINGVPYAHAYAVDR
ncbi:MAG: DUF424 family protein [Candidatus Marsarchaeota archaeon]|nr:DUF424 family protein [Candidatus Marsarchaeota archaeon]MCL5111334.1 DUF424 family protein [Candidatus Marsarchaeota archaeon]